MLVSTSPFFPRPRPSDLVGKVRSAVRVDSELAALIRGKGDWVCSRREDGIKRKASEDDRFSVYRWYDGILQCAEITVARNECRVRDRKVLDWRVENSNTLDVVLLSYSTTLRLFTSDIFLCAVLNGIYISVWRHRFCCEFLLLGLECSFIFTYTSDRT